MKITFEINRDLYVMDEVNHTIEQIEKALGNVHITVTGEHGEDIEQIREKFTDEDHEALNNWINYGGVLWIETSTIYPHNVQVMTTDDNGIMLDMYNSRSDEYKSMSLDEYLLMLSEKALIHMGIDPDTYITWY